MDRDVALRDYLSRLLSWGEAHMTFDSAVAEFPPDQMNARPPNVPYTPWQLLEHMRITQWDILGFIRDRRHMSPEWPEGYWPAKEEQAGEARWRETIQAFREDLAALQALASDPTTDLYAPIPHGDGQTTLREILLAADHNSFHLGEFAILRQVMGSWPKDREE